MRLHPQALPDELDLAGVAARLSMLATDAHWARRLPRLTAAAADLADAGFGPVVADLRARREAGESVTGESAVAVLDSVVAASLAEQIEQTNPVLAGTRGQALRETSQRWRQSDAAASVAAADVARATWGRHARSAATQRPVHVRLLRDAVVGRGPATTRDLLAGSWSTVLAARPVWLGGPLPVAAAMPVDVAFDLVVVLDAQSVALAHAIGVLARAEQVVVLGDPEQPPPSPTPLSVDTPDPRVTGQVPGAGVETPSVYAVLRDQLPSIDLTTRYGCRDARLHVAMPASRTGSTPAVPPGASAAPPLLFRHVEQEMGTREQEESVDREVEEVVDLVRAHVAGRPHASLAVLTLGRLHAEAIEAALARACLTDSALAEALGPEADEPFLLRPVDDLNGERRDAVILTVGFGRARDGRLLYRYGPLNRPGGVRWLTAAVATARRELVVVSSVTASDLEPRRLAADGLRGLRQLLATAEGIAVDGADDPAEHPALAQRPLDPLERAIASRLHEAGLPVLSGAGCGALTVGFGVEHPGRPGRGVLAVETEGGTFATIDDLRDRERMRPEQLMRAGWSVYRVCVADWLRDPEAEVASITAAWREAAHLADALDAARNAPAPAQDDRPADTDDPDGRRGRGAPIAAGAPDHRGGTSGGGLPDARPGRAGRVGRWPHSRPHRGRGGRRPWPARWGWRTRRGEATRCCAARCGQPPSPPVRRQRPHRPASTAGRSSTTPCRRSRLPTRPNGPPSVQGTTPPASSGSTTSDHRTTRRARQVRQELSVADAPVEPGRRSASRSRISLSSSTSAGTSSGSGSTSSRAFMRAW